MTGRQKVAVVVAEFLGTYVLASVILAMLLRTEFAFFSAIPAAIAYGLIYLMFDTSGGTHLNPAVTIGLWSIRKVATMQAIVMIIAQMVAGFVAFRLDQHLFGHAFSQVIPAAVGGVHWGAALKVLLAEGIGTAVFAMGIAAAALKAVDKVRYAVIAGTALLAGIAIASIASNGLLNPAVALAVHSWSWAYIVGPILGSVIGMNLYLVFFAPETLKVSKSAAKVSVAAKSSKSTKTTKSSKKKK